MKWNSVVVKGLILLIFATNSFAQFETTSFIKPYQLSITCNKTTNLIFPFAIQSVDRGSKDVLIQKVSGVENVLQIKADVPDFSETNLSVITTDGKLYSFILNYLKNPVDLNIVFSKDTINYINNRKIIFQEAKNEEEVSTIAERVLYSKKTLHGIKDRHETICFSLNGLYVHNDLFYLQLKFRNKSQVTYDINGIRFYIRDKKKSKRAAVQEREIQAIHVYGNSTSIKGDSTQSCVVVLPKFSLPDDKYLSIHAETGGGRDAQLTLRNHHLMKAKTIQNLF